MQQTISFGEASDRFSLIEGLEHNWDGDDAEPVQPELLKFSQEVIKKLLKKGHEEPFIGATPCGTIDLTWDDLGIHSVLSQPDDGMKILYINFPSICEKTTVKYSDYSEKAADQLSTELSGWLIKISQSHQ